MKGNLNVKISEIMSPNPKVLNPKDRISAAKKLFDQYDIHHIPVAEMGNIRGIISLGDLLFLEDYVTSAMDNFSGTSRYQFATVDEIMTGRPYCIAEDSTIIEALDIMIERRINCLPVINNGELSGILTNFDIIKYLKLKIEES